MDNEEKVLLLAKVEIHILSGLITWIIFDFNFTTIGYAIVIYIATNIVGVITITKTRSNKMARKVAKAKTKESTKKTTVQKVVLMKVDTKGLKVKDLKTSKKEIRFSFTVPIVVPGTKIKGKILKGFITANIEAVKKYLADGVVSKNIWRAKFTDKKISTTNFVKEINASNFSQLVSKLFTVVKKEVKNISKAEKQPKDAKATKSAKQSKSVKNVKSAKNAKTTNAKAAKSVKTTKRRKVA